MNKAGHYRHDYLKAKWKGTNRDGYRYSVSYAPTGAATCIGCKQKIAKGDLRVGRSSPNPFDAESGATDYTKFMHADHAFGVFQRSKCASAVPLRVTDLVGFEDLAPKDKARMRTALAAFVAERKKACPT